MPTGRLARASAANLFTSSSRNSFAASAIRWPDSSSRVKWLVGNSVAGSRLSQHALSNGSRPARVQSAAAKNASSSSPRWSSRTNRRRSSSLSVVTASLSVRPDSPAMERNPRFLGWARAERPPSVRTARSDVSRWEKDHEMNQTDLGSLLTSHDIIRSYRVAEFVTLARDGSPVCWPLAPAFERGRLVFSTGYMYPTKARNARRDSRVAALFSDPTASGRSADDPFVLVQGFAEVFDQDLQRNTERYVDQLLREGPLTLRLVLRLPWARRAMAGYLTRLFNEVTPQREYVWARQDAPPTAVREACRPGTFVPGAGIALPTAVFQWL